MRSVARRNGLGMVGLWAALAVVCVRADAQTSQPAERPAYGTQAGKARYVPKDYKAPAQRVQFVIYGDRTGSEQPGFMAQGIELANLLRPEFIVSIGDQIQGEVNPGKDVTPEQAERKTLDMWKEYDALVGQFQVPYFYTVGNHDMWNKPAAGIYTSLHGPTYYSFDARNVHVIVLNSEEYEKVGGAGSLGEAQIVWLQADLEKSKDAALTVIVVHNPVWHNPSRNDWAKVDAMLAGRNAIVFAGHEHKYTYEVRKGIPYVIVAAVAGVESEQRNEATGLFRHVTMVTVEDGKPYLAVVKLGAALPMEVTPLSTEQHLEKVYGMSRLDYLPAEPQVGQPVTIVWNLDNNESLPVQIKAAWEKDSPWQVEPAEFSATLAGGEKRRVEFAGHLCLKNASAVPTMQAQICWPDSDVPATRVSWQAAPLRRIEARTVPGIKIDGKVETAWGRAAAVTLDSTQQFSRLADWTGPKDLSVRARVAMSGGRLVLLAEVADDDIQAGNDVLTFGLAGVEADRVVDSSSRLMYRFAIRPPQADGPAEVRWQGKSRLPAEAAASRTEAGWTVEVAVDVAPLVKKAAGAVTVPFNVFFSDFDADQPSPTEAFWSGAKDWNVSTRQWGQLTIPAEAAEAIRSAATQEAAPVAAE